jgi:hypothetical protein
LEKGEGELKLIMHFVADVKCMFYPPATLIKPVLVRLENNVKF